MTSTPSSTPQVSQLLRIALIGGECTGKSSLAEALAKQYHTICVPEFARDYLIPRNGQYTLGQSILIAQGQVDREDDMAAKANRILFCDTDALATMIWSEYYFGQSYPAVRELAYSRHYDLYLLTSPDFPWVDDGLRRSPDSREWFDQRFQQELESRHLPYVRVTGPLPHRMQTAQQAIEPLLVSG